MRNESPPTLVWFRQDLRLDDNPALRAAAQSGPVVPLYIHDSTKAARDHSGNWEPGEASRWWLYHSLQALNVKLEGHLYCHAGDPVSILASVAAATGAKRIFWNRCYEPWRTQQDKLLQKKLGTEGYEIRIFKGSLLREPEEAVKNDGTPYRVFTPFYRNYQKIGAPAPPKAVPDHISFIKPPNQKTGNINSLALLPPIKWYPKLERHWQPGEDGAQERLHIFLSGNASSNISNYKTGRDRPDHNSVSCLSPFLHFGEISPRRIWDEAIKNGGPDAEPFLRQLVWRDFSAHLLHHYPDLPSAPLQENFARFPWRSAPDELARWQRGLTGYPFVDAGMRQLWKTGYMHNRVRMVTASFLVKNLLIHWHEGQNWFWDTLVDADLANNSASWQWVAGCGADAAPYFRIFNPVLQSKKFDPDGAYIRRWVPELADLPDKYLHEPWTAPEKPENYPDPIGDHSAMRKRALAAYQTIKSS